MKLSRPANASPTIFAPAFFSRNFATLPMGQSPVVFLEQNSRHFAYRSALLHSSPAKLVSSPSINFANPWAYYQGEIYTHSIVVNGLK
jgi:hypothetical protein